MVFGWGAVAAVEVCGDKLPLVVAVEDKEKTRRTRPLVCLGIQPRMIKEAVAGRSRIDRARARGLKIMTPWPYITLLVVTVRAAWFNFRGWTKRP